MVSRKVTARALRLLAPVVAALLLAHAPGSAEAGRWRLLSRLTRPATPRGPGTVGANGARYRPAAVSGTLAHKARGKPIMAVGRGGDARAYARDLRDTVEVLFQPRASDYGHVLVRIGEQVYDMPNSFGARAQPFHQALRWVHSPMYGFVFDSTPQRVAELDKAFRALIASRPRFSPSGSGPDTFSCAAFVSHILESRAPELRVGLSIAASGLASDLLRGGAHQALTLYGSAASEAGSDSFTFERIED